MIPTPTPVRIERGVYRRSLNGRDEYGSRCDDLTGRTTYAWGFSTAVKARHDYQTRRAQVRHARLAGADTPVTQATVAELTAEYLRGIDGKRVAYQSKVQHLTWWAERFRQQPILTIRPSQIEDGLAQLVKQGLAPATANRYGASLRRLMRKMVTPFERVVEVWKRVEFYEEPESIPIPLSDQEEEQLYRSMDLQDALYVRLDVIIGVRLSQFFTQRWEWLNWEQALIHLPRFKRHPARLLPIPQEGMAIYAILWEQQGRPREGWIFPVRKQTAIGAGKSLWKPGPIVYDRTRAINARNWYTRHYRPAVLKAKLREGITFHTLRKTWASRMGAHTPTIILQILGGWKSDVVRRYSLPFIGQMRDSMERAARSKSVRKVSMRKTAPIGKLAKLLKSKKNAPVAQLDRASVS